MKSVVESADSGLGSADSNANSNTYHAKFGVWVWKHGLLETSDAPPPLPQPILNPVVAP